MAAKQGPAAAGPRPPYPAVPAAKGEKQESPPPVLPRAAALPDGAGPASQKQGAGFAAPAVPAPSPEALLTPPLQEHNQLPEPEAGATAAAPRTRASRQKSRQRRAKHHTKAITVAPEEFEQIDEHVRALPETFESHHPVAAEDQPQLTQQQQLAYRGRLPNVAPRPMPPLWRPQLLVRPPPSLWAPKMRAPLERHTVFSNSASEVVVHGYIQPPARQQGPGAVQVEDGGGDLLCAACTIVALACVLLWLYMAISANYRKGRSVSPLAEFSTLDTEDREAEVMLGALEAAARTESRARHSLSNTSEQQGLAVLTGAF